MDLLPMSNADARPQHQNYHHRKWKEAYNQNMRFLTLLLFAIPALAQPSERVLFTKQIKVKGTHPLKRLLRMPMFWQVIAQTPHFVTIRLIDNNNNPASTTYSVYRANGLCAGSPAFSAIATGLTMPSPPPPPPAFPSVDYTDNGVTPGTYCYAGTATFAGSESAKGNTVQPSVPAAPPTTAVTQVQ